MGTPLLAASHFSGTCVYSETGVPLGAALEWIMGIERITVETGEMAGQRLGMGLCNSRRL